MRQSCPIRGKTTGMIAHLLRLLHLLQHRLRPSSLANAPLQCLNAPRALLHLQVLLRPPHSLLHRAHQPRAQSSAPLLTSKLTDRVASGRTLRSPANTSLLAPPASRGL